MIVRARVLISTALFCGVVHGIHAQSPATLIGIVMRDSAGTRVGGAEVRLSAVREPVKTNYLGEFRINAVPQGKYELTIRRLGFLSYRDSVEIPASGRVEREFILAEQPVALDSVRIGSVAERKYISPALNAFEERRKAGFGHFITDSVLRRNDDRPLVGVLVSYIPGIRIARGAGTYISSTRKCGSGPAILTCRGAAVQCPPAMYVDGILVYNAAVQTDPRLRPDLNEMPVKQFAAAEFYGGGATIPAQYNQTGNDCGVLLLWTRER
jgi:hypothetical protein